MVETQLYVEEADHLENLEDLETQPYMEKEEEVDYLESLEELDLARLSVEMQQATGFQDNVGVTVVMPGEDIRQAANNEVRKSIEQLSIQKFELSIVRCLSTPLAPPSSYSEFSWAAFSLSPPS